MSQLKPFDRCSGDMNQRPKLGRRKEPASVDYWSGRTQEMRGTFAQIRTFQWETRSLESGHPFITMMAHATSVIVMLSADAHPRRY
jgi:hypothetical protein